MERTRPGDALADGRADLRAARTGDAEAARRLVAAFGASMDRTARSVLGRSMRADVEDVVQEALLAAWTTTALPDGDVGAWLRAIVVRKALDQARRRQRRAEDPIERDPEASGPRAVVEPSVRPTVDEAIEAEELLDRLPAKDRAVLWLADVEGRSMAEIAGVLGTTRVAVKLRASRARRALARHAKGRDAG